MIPTIVLGLLYVIAPIVSLLLLYVVIRLAATHALHSHAVWLHEGGVDKAIAKREQALRD